MSLSQCIGTALNNSHTEFDLRNKILRCLGSEEIQKAPQSMVGIWGNDEEVVEEDDQQGLSDLQNDVREAINMAGNEEELRTNLFGVLNIVEPHSPGYAPDNLRGGIKKSRRKTHKKNKKNKRKTHKKRKVNKRKASKRKSYRTKN
jgi:hypothetical protein